MKFYCEIVQDFDVTYYANMTEGGTDSNGVWHEPKLVEGLPVNVTYKQLCEGIRKVTGVSMVQRKYLKFKSMGRKKYAYVDATQHIPEGCGCCPTWEQTKKYPPNWD
jgi:hypothetical protein